MLHVLGVCMICHSGGSPTNPLLNLTSGGLMCLHCANRPAR